MPPPIVVAMFQTTIWWDRQRRNGMENPMVISVPIKSQANDFPNSACSLSSKSHASDCSLEWKAKALQRNGNSNEKLKTRMERSA